MEKIDGNAIAKAIIGELTEEVKRVCSNDRPPKVAFIRVGDEPASVSYVSKKQKTAAKIGIDTQLTVLDEAIGEAELLKIIDAYNLDESIDGILIQAPLPKHIDTTAVFNRVSAEKDVDGFGRVNLGKLCQEDVTGFVACTPAGIIELLKRSKVDTQGRHAVVVGRSLIVGKPIGLLLLQRKLEGGNATVSFCHSHTPDLGNITCQADILITALGSAHAIGADEVKEGAVVIDVGINRIEDSSRKSGYRLVGDVDFAAVSPIAAKITPVPGGVGPMTVAMLMRNTFKAYQLARSVK